MTPLSMPITCVGQQTFPANPVSPQLYFVRAGDGGQGQSLGCLPQLCDKELQVSKTTTNLTDNQFKNIILCMCVGMYMSRYACGGQGTT